MAIGNPFRRRKRAPASEGSLSSFSAGHLPPPRPAASPPVVAAQPITPAPPASAAPPLEPRPDPITPQPQPKAERSDLATTVSPDHIENQTGQKPTTPSQALALAREGPGALDPGDANVDDQPDDEDS